MTFCFACLVVSSSKVAACAKHFVGDGGTTNGINENNTVIDYKGLVDIHMAPYFDSIAKGVSTVMISYTSWNGMKMHANKFLVTQVLKYNLKFKVNPTASRQTCTPAGSYLLIHLNGLLDLLSTPTFIIPSCPRQVRSGYRYLERSRGSY